MEENIVCLIRKGDIFDKNDLEKEFPEVKDMYVEDDSDMQYTITVNIENQTVEVG